MKAELVIGGGFEDFGAGAGAVGFAEGGEGPPKPNRLPILLFAGGGLVTFVVVVGLAPDEKSPHSLPKLS